jgi:hypothetical protein
VERASQPQQIALCQRAGQPERLPEAGGAAAGTAALRSVRLTLTCIRTGATSKYHQNFKGALTPALSHPMGEGGPALAGLGEGSVRTGFGGTVELRPIRTR